MEKINIIGGGLSGSEAAWQTAQRGVSVRLFEMRPVKTTGAHKTELLGELVCSNSLKSKDPFSASGLLKRELELAGSLIMEAARATCLPAGSALAVDRGLFPRYITRKIEFHPLIEVVRKEVEEIPSGLCIIATGPLTSDRFSKGITHLLGGDALFFYDAIAPIVEAESIDFSKAFKASRYDKGGRDYVNCPMNKDEYETFYNALIKADEVVPHRFENKRMFEACMPIEIMARRGKDTLRFGPMRPVGLKDPRTGREAYAVLQLRSENREESAYNMVGFQTRLKQAAQEKVFRLIPGLENAVFLRYGSIHRNTFINSPELIEPDLSLKKNENIFITGQLLGVEGYLESTAMGLVSGINASKRMKGILPKAPPRTSAHGSLISYITESSAGSFQPSNINFALLPVPEEAIRNKKKRRELIIERALKDWKNFLNDCAY